jgi:hypothetical protein
MTGMGQEEPFPPQALPAADGFEKRSFAVDDQATQAFESGS